MGNTYKQIGPFVYGDTRFLANGSKSACISYSNNNTSVSATPVIPPAIPTSSLYSHMHDLGQAIAVGKSGYHGNQYSNIFVREEDRDMPTVGIEVETIMRSCTSESAQRFTKSLYSNWFHAESDGSLDRAHGGTYGYEIVTGVLPARIYRDINVWTGFQNLLSPLLHSYTSTETGLHVHVGMEFFENTNLPAAPLENIMLAGKILTSKIYYSFLPRTLAQRVFLRNSDLHYCHETYLHEMARPIQPMTGYQLIDNVFDILLSSTGYGSVEDSLITRAFSAVHEGMSASEITNQFRNTDRLGSSSCLNYGHDSELNASPKLTLEFRRGKGTTNALSIHRMIELCVLTVMYAAHVIDNPSEIVSTDNYLSYVIDNTKSTALKTLAEKEKAKTIA